MTVEERLTQALHEVAGRLPEPDVAAPPPPPAPEDLATRRAWLLAAAAIVTVVAVLAGLLVLRRDGRDVPVATAEAPRRTILSAKVEGYDVRLDTIGGDCVVVVMPEPFAHGEERRACAGDERFALEATIRGGKTIVYGIARGAARFSGAVAEVTAPDLHQTTVDGGAVFLMVIDVNQASGSMSALDSNGHIVATASFDRGGPGRAPRGTIADDASIDFAYLRAGAIWVHPTVGQDVRVTDGTLDASDGVPVALADGRTILHTTYTFDRPYDALVATDAHTGTAHDIGVNATAFLAVSPDGSLIAGGTYSDDAGNPSDLVVVRTDTFEQVARVTLGTEEAVGVVSDAVWSSDGRSMLVSTRGHPERLLSVNIDGGSIRTLDTGVAKGRWLLGDGPAQGQRFRAVLVSDDRAVYGAIDTDASAHWNGLAEVDIAPSDDLYFDEGAAHELVGDGHTLYEMDVTGRLRKLLEDVTYASAP